MQILLHGYTGKMGQMLLRKAAEMGSDFTICAKVSPDCPQSGTDGCYCSLAQYPGTADCVIDFSNHAATAGLLAYCTARKLPVVIATTGQTEEERAQIAQAAAEIPIFFSANMSIGIAVLGDLAKKAAAAFPQADIEIIEAHHNQKLDVPSGTALLLAHQIQQVRQDSTLLIGRHENGRRTAQEIGIHSLRFGAEVGMHEILISTGSETLTLKHKAESRSLFADGALKAAAFLSGKPAGLYTMQDLVV